MGDFRLLSNHGLTLLCIADDPTVRMRDIAGRLGITERGAQRIVAELVDAGFLERQRIGRRNRYRIRSEQTFQLPTGQPVRVGALLDLLREPAVAPRVSPGEGLRSEEAGQHEGADQNQHQSG